jgi:predicted nucleic acid-binding protein
MNIFLDANICLDLLDTTRPTSKSSINWYMAHKDDASLIFYFSGDFITTFYYILTQRRKINSHKVVYAIDALSQEVMPFYLNHADFLNAKNSFAKEAFNDFEDLIILHSALRAKCNRFMTNDSSLVKIREFCGVSISRI